MNYHCEHCGRLNTARLYDGVDVHRCNQCGAAHRIGDMRAVCISDRVPTVWMPSHFRPSVPGVYDVRYTDCERRLWWGGTRFMDANDRIVSDKGMVSWRGHP